MKSELPSETSFSIPLDLSVDVWLTGDGKVNVTVMQDGGNVIARAHLTYEELYQDCGFAAGILPPEEETARVQDRKRILQKMEKFVNKKLGK